MILLKSHSRFLLQTLLNRLHIKWIWVRYMAKKPSLKLKTENGAVRINLSNNMLVTKDSPVKRNDENKIKRAKNSEKAKVNELKLFRLMARKKMDSPNPEVRIRYKLEEAKRKEAWLIEKLRKFEVPKALTEALDPSILTDTLCKDKALAKCKDSQSLEHTRKVIEKLEKELEEYPKHIAKYEATKESQDSKHFMHFEDLVLYFNSLKK